jgi:transcriptional regulator with XRE-family HTH domain
MTVFGERLEQLRGDTTQRDFARKMGIPLNSYTNWVLGLRTPNIDTLVKISTQMGVSADWLLGLDDKRGAPASGVNAKIVELKRNAETTAEAINDLLRAIEKLEGAL